MINPCLPVARAQGRHFKKEKIYYLNLSKSLLQTTQILNRFSGPAFCNLKKKIHSMKYFLIKYIVWIHFANTKKKNYIVGFWIHPIIEYFKTKTAAIIYSPAKWYVVYIYSTLYRFFLSLTHTFYAACDTMHTIRKWYADQSAIVNRYYTLKNRKIAKSNHLLVWK